MSEKKRKKKIWKDREHKPKAEDYAMKGDVLDTYHSVLPDAIMEHSGLTPAAKIVYAGIVGCMYRRDIGAWTISLDRLQKKTGLGHTAVSNAIQALEKYRIIWTEYAGRALTFRLLKWPGFRIVATSETKSGNDVSTRRKDSRYSQETLVQENGKNGAATAQNVMGVHEAWRLANGWRDTLEAEWELEEQEKPEVKVKDLFTMLRIGVVFDSTLQESFENMCHGEQCRAFDNPAGEWIARAAGNRELVMQEAG